MLKKNTIGGYNIMLLPPVKEGAFLLPRLPGRINPADWTRRPLFFLNFRRTLTAEKPLK